MPEDEPAPSAFVGRSLPRREDARFLTGAAVGVEDIRLPNLAHLAFVRSPFAHARIDGVDVAKTRELPGVAGVWTIDDLPAIPLQPAGFGPARLPLAKDKARFFGEPVVAVVADDPYRLADACALVTVDYEELPAVTGIDAATAEGAPLVFDELGRNELYAVPPAGVTDEDLDSAPRRARLRIVNQRCAAVPLETLACVADWDAHGLTLWATTQTPHGLRNHLATLLGLPQSQIRVVAPNVGGGFGAKNAIYPEYLLAPLLARQLGRPVRSSQTRTESLSHMHHGRDQVHEVEIGFDDDARIQAMRIVLSQNLGAYTDPVGMSLVGTAMLMSVGCYAIPRYAAGIRVVMTHTPPVSAYRGAGRPEGAFTIERLVDLVAAETGVDPAEARRRNFIDPDDFPHTNPSGLVYDSGNYRAALDRVQQEVGYDDLRQEQRLRRERGDTRLLGIGLASFIDFGGVGPSSQMGQLYLGGWESARLRISPDGSATIASGLSPHGQGTETAFTQIAADRLGIPPDRITVIHGDTAATPEGIGTFGSRGIAVGGEAVAKACAAIMVEATAIAAHLLGAEPGEVERREGRFVIAATPQRSVGWEQVARAAYVPTSLPPGVDPGLDTTAFYEPAQYTCSFGAHCCVVEVDREDGSTRVLRYVAVDDAGTIINPALAEGQMHGGLAQGISQALYEHVAFDGAGRPLADTLKDYIIPTAVDLPPFETVFTTTPSPVNSLGAKGIGESGTTGAPAAVINGIVDALSHLGVRNVDMPATPRRVWEAIQRAGR